MIRHQSRVFSLEHTTSDEERLPEGAHVASVKEEVPITTGALTFLLPIATDERITFAHPYPLHNLPLPITTGSPK